MPTFVTPMITIMNTRLKQFIAAENITQAQFADSINVVRASVSHILAGRNKPGYEFISGLMRHYPNLNLEWLMFGKGKMYKDSRPEQILQEAELPAEELSDDGYGDLFSEITAGPSLVPGSPVQNAPESNIPVQSPAPETPTITLNEIKTLISASQKPINQRKLVKIMAFFDDGTFQELTSI